MSSSKGGGLGKLDDLMMAYADLNTPAKTSGFKGPPVREIKREVKAVNYQPSTKARNWRTLDQSLESAFTNDTSTYTAYPSLNAVGDIGSFFQLDNSPGPTQGGSSSLPVSTQPSSSQAQDDWGEFQAYPSPAHSLACGRTGGVSPLNQIAYPNHPGMGSQPAAFQWSSNQTNNLQPTSLQFSSIPTYNSSPGSAPIPSATPIGILQAASLTPIQPISLAAPVSPSQQIGISLAAPVSPIQPIGISLAAPVSPIQPMGFSQAAPVSPIQPMGISQAAPVPPIQPNSLFYPSYGGGEHPLQKLSQDISALNISGIKPEEGGKTNNIQAVGCRLASFQEESPVHRFKPTQQQRAPSFEDFGDFVDFQSAPAAIPSSTAPVVQIKIDSPFGGQGVPTLAARRPVEDKYSALRDIFSSSSCEALDTSSDNLILNSSYGKSSSDLLQAATPTAGHNTSSDNLILNSSGHTQTDRLAPLTPTAGHNTSSDHLLFANTSNVSLEHTVTSGLTPQKIDLEDFWSLSSGSLPAAPQTEPNPWSTTSTADDDFGDFGEFVEPVAVSSSTFSGLQHHFQTLGQPSFPSENKRPGLDISSGLNLPSYSAFSLPLQSMNSEEDVDEWSLPVTHTDQSQEPVVQQFRPKLKAYGGLFHAENSSSLPYYSSSPPGDYPPPLDTSAPSVGLDFQLPSEQFQLSDQELFGTVREKLGRAVDTPSSLHDVIHLQLSNKSIGDKKLKPSKEFIETLPTVGLAETVDTLAALDTKETVDTVPPVVGLTVAWPPSSTKPSTVDLDLPALHVDPDLEADSINDEVFVTKDSQESSKSDSPTSLRIPVRSPESVSIASLEFEKEETAESTETAETTETAEKERAMLDDWLIALSQMLALLDSAADTFSKIDSPELRLEVSRSTPGEIYLKNLQEIYRICLRIQHTTQARSIVEVELTNVFHKIHKSWHHLKIQTQSPEVLENPGAGLLSAHSYTVHHTPHRPCAICLSPVEHPGSRIFEENLGDFNVGVVAYDGGEYHAACANFWVNCVDVQLPNFT